MVIDFLCMFLLCYYVTVLPMIDGLQNFIQIFNEAIVTLTVVSLFLFTDYVDDPEVKYQFGLYFTVVVGFNIGVNLIILITNVILQIKIACRRFCLKR